MNLPKSLSGTKCAQDWHSQISIACQTLWAQYKKQPRLDVIIVGNNPASQIYVMHKERASQKVGIEFHLHRLPADCPATELELLIENLNNNSLVDGILLQLPLPDHLEKRYFLSLINPLKDVDGLHPDNLGLLVGDTPRFIPCTPLGILRLLNYYSIPLSGTNIVMIGRSLLVGKPLAILLTSCNATVTLAHSHTTNIQKISRDADIIIIAAGQPHLMTDEWVSPHSVIIDVGMHYINKTITGDVSPSATMKAQASTPTPGGVGPMTVTALLANVLKAAQSNHHA